MGPEHFIDKQNELFFQTSPEIGTAKILNRKIKINKEDNYFKMMMLLLEGN